MTFVRTTDLAEYTPVLVFGPYENARESRNVAVPLMESSNVRVVYNYTSLRTGTLNLLVERYADAVEAANFFAAQSSFNFNGPYACGGYVIEDGMVVTVGEVDETFDLRFFVAGGAIEITQADPMWEVRVPFHELIEVTP